MSLNMIGDITFPSLTIAQNSTMFTASIPFRFCNGYASARITSSAGSITINQQCSPDNIYWFNPVDKTNTAIGVVATAMSADTAGRYVQYDPVLSGFIRFKVVELNVAATTVSIMLYAQEGA